MPRYVALLRAINVGGHTVKMDRLRLLFEEAGFTAVETFIASGNVLFDSASRDPRALEPKIATALEKALGYPVATFVRTPAELESLVRSQPFTGIGGELHAIYVAFLASSPDAAARGRLEASGTPDDLLRVVGSEAWWLCRKAYSESTLTGPHIEKTLGIAATLRNLTTVARLVSRLAGEGAGSAKRKAPAKGATMRKSPKGTK